MTKAKDEHARQNALRRQKAAELIALQMRKRQRVRTDEALLTTVGAPDPADKPSPKHPKR